MSDEFYVDLSKIASGRTPGVSGILRVKNDAEFLEASIESCIDALDELVIVYNDCSDASPLIISKMQKKYRDKIKVYPYLPHIISGNLSYEDYCFIKNEPASSPHQLSNYYNYALSKTTKSHVIKIDADQIYFKNTLSRICDAYRGKLQKKPDLKDIQSFIWIVILFLKTKYTGAWASDADMQKHFRGYSTTALWLASKYNIPLSLSGINTIYNDGEWFVPLGLENNNLNILPPFNGVGDHLIFKVTPETFFVPYDCIEYSRLTSSKYNYIERLAGVNRYFPVCFAWIHLNGNRSRVYKRQQQNIIQYPNCFIPIEEFVNSSFTSFEKLIPMIMLPQNHRRTFRILFEGSKNLLPIDEVRQYHFSEEFILERKHE